MSSNQNPNQSQSQMEMHRVSWPGADGTPLCIFLASSEPKIVRKAAERLAFTIAAESGVSVSDDVLLSADFDLTPFEMQDDLPF